LAACEGTRTAAARALAPRASLWIRRRRGRPNVIGLVLAAAAGFASTPSKAQVADVGADLLQPTLEGNPATPPRFRLPGPASGSAGDQPLPTGAFVAPSRIGVTPSYGSPSGFGAGRSGFDSSNTPRRKKERRAARDLVAAQSNATFAPVSGFQPPPPTSPPVLPPAPLEIYPKKAAARVGATLPPPPDPLPMSNPPAEVHPLSAAARPGAVLPVPPPYYFDYSASTPPPTLPQPGTFAIGTLPQRPLPLAAADPYAALGIRSGSFLLLPSLDLSGGYNSNPEHVSGSPGSSFFVVAPELQVRSDWERHSLTADIVGSYTAYGNDTLVPSLNAPYLNSKIDGTIDVTRGTQILLENRVIVSTDNPGSPNLQTQLAQLPPNQDVGGTLGLVQQFNRLAVTLKGLVDRATYDDSELTNGERASNADRNFDQYAAVVRVAYEIDPGLKPFVEVQEDQRVHDEEFDRSGLQRDSTGASVQAGAALDLFGSLTGEMAIGYLERTYQDPSLPQIAGPTANGTLIWQASALTTAKLTATSQVYETVLDGASGQFSHDLTLQVDHAFRTWLVGTLKCGYGNDNYVGALTDNRYFASLGLAYKFTREWQIRGELRQDWQTASQPGFSYTGTSLLFGVRMQR
jgi:hypothetical protein